MEDWPLAKLKAHLQFELGRLDGYRWVLDRCEFVHDEDNDIDKVTIQDKIRDVNATVRGVEGLIAKILEEREAKKQAEKDRRAQVHKDLTQDKEII